MIAAYTGWTDARNTGATSVTLGRSGVFLDDDAMQDIAAFVEVHHFLEHAALFFVGVLMLRLFRERTVRASTKEDIARIITACASVQARRVVFPWAKGDVLIIDNRVTMHSREPFTDAPGATRRILASLWGPHNPHAPFLLPVDVPDREPVETGAAAPAATAQEVIVSAAAAAAATANAAELDAAANIDKIVRPFRARGVCDGRANDSDSVAAESYF